MFLTVHGAVGILLGEMAPNPWLAFLYGFLAHFPLDMFPHGDRVLGARARESRQYVRRYFIMIIADIIVGLTVVVSGFWLGKFERPWQAYWGMLGGILPDLLVAIPTYAMFVKKSLRVHLRRFYRFHTFNHNCLIAKFDLPMRIGLVGQGLLLLLMWKLW